MSRNVSFHVLGEAAQRQVMAALEAERIRDELKAEAAKPKRKSKYNAEPVTIDGIRFDSKAEGKRYTELKLLERAGEISGLELQPKFIITVNGFKICEYNADFRYVRDGKIVVEDVKSEPTKTPVYRLKKKLVYALHGVEITEICK